MFLCRTLATDWYKKLGFSSLEDKWKSPKLPNNVMSIIDESTRHLESLDPYVLSSSIVKYHPLLFSKIYWQHCGDNIGSVPVVKKNSVIVNRVIHDIMTSKGIGYISTKPKPKTLKKYSKTILITFVIVRH